MAITNTSAVTDEKLKIIYDTAYMRLCGESQGFVRQCMNFGTRRNPGAGGKSFNWEVLSGRKASGGFANATSLSHLNDTEADAALDEQGAFTFTSVFGRTEVDIRQIAVEQGGEMATFIRDSIVKIEDMQAVLMDMVEILHSNVSDGTYFDTVGATTAAISNGSSGSVTVDHVQWIPYNTPMQVKRSGSVVANVVLVCRDKREGAGAAVLTMKNEGSTSYTPTANDVLIPAYSSTDGIFFSSVEEAIGVAAYPRSEAQNTQITAANFKSIVFDAGTQTVTFDMVRELFDAIDDAAPAETWTPANGNFSMYGGRQSHPGVIQVPKNLSNQLQKAFSIYRRDTTVPFERYDVGWGKVFEADGLVFAPNRMWPSDRIRYVDTREFAFGNGTFEFLTMGRDGNWQQLPSSTKAEALAHWRLGIVAQRRQRMGKIYGLQGITASDLGLTAQS